MALTKVTERIISDNLSISGIATASNFKTGTTNVHNVGVEAAGINVLGADTPIGTGSTIWKDGGALFSGIVTATSFVGNVTGNVTGNISGGTVAGSTGAFSSDVTISGDLGVAGTLTYEDVARVDAIGLSTYREGLNIGPLAGIALTAYKDGSIRSTGIITATSFSGNITGNVTGNVTGTASNASGATGDFSIADKIIHTGDTNTALRFPSADTITAETGGSERLRINSAGDVLVNTTTAFNSLNGRGNLVVGSGSGNEGITIYAGSSNTGGLTFADGVSGSEAYIGQVEYDHSINAMRFYTNASERLRILSDGRVLIGTTTPSTYTNRQLVVGDTSTNSSFIEIRCSSSSTGHLLFSDSAAGDSNNYTGYIAYHHSDNRMTFHTDGGNERLRIDDVGDVAIGGCAVNTFSNYQTLTIGGARAVDGVGIDLERSDGNIYGRFFADANGIQLQTSQSGDYFRFETHNGSGVGERVRIASNGNVGINKSSPDHKLDVAASQNNYGIRSTGGIRLDDNTANDKQIATAAGIFYTTTTLTSSNNTWFTVAKIQYSSGSFTCVVGDASSRNVMTGHFCATVPAYGVSVFSKKESSGAWNTGSSDIQMVNDGSYMAIQVKHDSYYNDSNSAGCYLMLVQCY